MSSVGRFAGRLEEAFAGVWSLGEIALALARPHEVLEDPHRERLRRDVERRGFHVPIDARHLAFRESRRGTISGTNPYLRVGGGPPERVIGKLRRRDRTRRAKHLVVACHCYGVPSATMMRALFGFGGIDADVVLNVMGHHQNGTFMLWPGSGLASARTSRFVENVRSAVTGARALVTWLREHGEYETVSAVGFSIGGQLALHLAHAGEIDRALLYCPVTSVGTTARSLGFMKQLSGVIDPAIERLHGGGMDELLRLADPLGMSLAIPEENLHVVVHKHDALTPPEHVEPIRERYPSVGWTELGGTHLLPVGLGELHKAVQRALSV